MSFTQVSLSELNKPLPSDPSSFDEWADFMAKGRGQAKAKGDCTPGKSYPCKSICLTTAKNCRNPLEGQAKNYADWLKAGGEKFKPTKETNPKGKAGSSKQKKTSDPTDTTHDWVEPPNYSHGADYELDKIYKQGKYTYRKVPREPHPTLGTQSPNWDGDYDREEIISKDEYDKLKPEFDKLESTKGTLLNQGKIVEIIAKKTGMSKVETKKAIKSLGTFTGHEFDAIRMADRGATKDDEGRNISKFKKDADIINNFLEKAPKYEGTIYRGLPIEDKSGRSLVDKLKSEGGYNQTAMASFSSSPEVAKNFANKGNLIMVVKQNKRGVSVRNLSAEPQEDEVLIPKGTRYRASGEPYQKDGITYIEVEEF